MTVQDVDNYIYKKLEKDSKYIRYTFYELRVKQGLSKEECDRFLELNEIYFKNKKYSVYRTGTTFEYDGKKRTVESNELMIIVKQ